MVDANPLSIFCRAKLKPSNFRCMDISHHIHNPSIFCAEQGEWAKTSKVGLERVMTLNCISTLPVLIRFLSVMLCEVEEVVCSRVFINTREVWGGVFSEDENPQAGHLLHCSGK